MYKVGDRIRCIDDMDMQYITAHKQYTVLAHEPSWVTIENDSGVSQDYHASRFELVERNKSVTLNAVVTAYVDKIIDDMSDHDLKCFVFDRLYDEVMASLTREGSK